MKKLALSILVLFVITFSNAYSQSVYVKLGGGYGLGLATDVITSSAGFTNWEMKYGTYGEGINFQAGFGYNITPNIAVELDGSYTMGRKFEGSFNDMTPIINFKNYANTISILPSVIIRTCMKDIKPYARIGMVIGIPTKYTEETQTGTGARTGSKIYKETGNLALGFQGAGGVNFKVAKQLEIFAEIFGIGMSYGPGKRENTQNYTGLPLEQTITYSESGTYEPFGNTSYTPRYQFSSFGMNVGLTYTFGK